MVGFRKESFYVGKYGEEKGKSEYARVESARLVRSTRRSNSSDTVECCICHKSFKRITRTHLKSGCLESNTPEEYKIRFPNAEIIAQDLKQMFSNTQESIIDKYGDQIGNEKWKNYQEIQAETNTFEYKSKKYNMSTIEFDEYNKSRSSTLYNFVERHGEERGLDLWSEYCDRQQYTTTIDYFIEKYGKDAGIQKFNNFCLARNLAGKHQSDIEIEVYNELKSFIADLELSVRLDNMYYGPYDYGNCDKKKLIEFYGTYWHSDSRKYADDYYHKQRKMLAKSIRSRDQAKRTYAINNGYSVMVIWEQDWRENKDESMKHVMEFWNKND